MHLILHLLEETRVHNPVNIEHPVYEQILSGGIHLFRGDMAMEWVPRRPPQRRQFSLVIRRRRGGPRVPHHRVSRSGRGRRTKDL